LTLDERRRAVTSIIKLTEDWIDRKVTTQVLTVDNFSDAVTLLNYVQKEHTGRYAAIFESLKKQAGCPAGKGILSIDHHGVFHPCQFWQSEDILPHDWKSRLRGRCGACEYKDICGGCRVRAYQRHADFLQEDPSCEINIVEHN
jgi:radical SAM protein with 4Fe4S-binding SPASM domain